MLSACDAVSLSDAAIWFSPLSASSSERPWMSAPCATSSVSPRDIVGDAADFQRLGRDEARVERASVTGAAAVYFSVPACHDMLLFGDPEIVSPSPSGSASPRLSTSARSRMRTMRSPTVAMPLKYRPLMPRSPSLGG